ncbi:ABC transporter permease [Nesterenkonia ebinurensis]|uniref:ABC transporter permease n=1 Tax=Nesterenkonia ebinurensis TaxID=2608252 RepID=UPI00123D79C3|nr:ABC transporter permease [Nesterenkonia ebinurensis]
MKGTLLFLLHRLMWAVLVCLVAVVLIFLLIRVAPGDPIGVLAGEQATPEYQDRLREQLGLNEPVLTQLWLYLGALLQGDLGYSFAYSQPVSSLIASRVFPTLLLMGVTLIVAVIIGVWVGAWAAVKRDSPVFRGTSILAVIAYSLPAFWVGQLLVLAFGVRLGWFPTIGMSSIRSLEGWDLILDIAWHLAMPVATLAAAEVALISRLTESAMREVMESDYIVAAKGKGLSQRQIVYRHGLRNAMLPVITVVGLELGWLVAGFVVVETVFSWPGLGTLTFNAIQARDFPVITGLFIVITVSVVLANLLTDLIYLIVDPRIRID